MYRLSQHFYPPPIFFFYVYIFFVCVCVCVCVMLSDTHRKHTFLLYLYLIGQTMERPSESSRMNERYSTQVEIISYQALKLKTFQTKSLPSPSFNKNCRWEKHTFFLFCFVWCVIFQDTHTRRPLCLDNDACDLFGSERIPFRHLSQSITKHGHVYLWHPNLALVSFWFILLCCTISSVSFSLLRLLQCGSKLALFDISDADLFVPPPINLWGRSLPVFFIDRYYRGAALLFCGPLFLIDLQCFDFFFDSEPKQ